MHLQADLSKRYGCLANGAADIKAHPWFKGTDWPRVARREDAAPIRFPDTPLLSSLCVSERDV